VYLGTGTTYNLTGITPSYSGFTYYFVVQATDAGGTTNSNQAVGTTTGDTSPPSDPTGFFVGTNSSYPTGINYYWNDSTDNASSQANIGYQLCNTGCNPQYTIAAGGGALVTSSYLGNGASGVHGSALASNTTQTFWIRAVDQAGNYSNWVSVSGTTAVSYSTNITPILSICNGCHSGGAYTPGPYSYSFWTNAGTKTTQAGGDCSAGKLFISPGNPGGSLIYQRMNGQAVSGCSVSDQMPQGGPYNAANITTMYNWILQGAVNN
jgi:hypothetical protein